MDLWPINQQAEDTRLELLVAQQQGKRLMPTRLCPVQRRLAIRVRLVEWCVGANELRHDANVRDMRRRMQRSGPLLILQMDLCT